ncbi:MAG: hypothetical protein IJL78_08940 [Lachnospiraceae bacterium]|nr:hypothetical protein [Lachnospiraceae bacterium]
MYKKAKRKSALLFVCGGLAIAVCLALIGFIAYILVLRTDYKETCLEINDMIVASPSDRNFVVRDGETYPLSEEALNWYDQIFLDRKAVVMNRKEAEPDKNSIVLLISDCTLTLTGQDDGTAFAMCWETPDGVKHYQVRSTNYTFTSMNSYLKSYLKRFSTQSE